MDALPLANTLGYKFDNKIKTSEQMHHIYRTKETIGDSVFNERNQLLIKTIACYVLIVLARLKRVFYLMSNNIIQRQGSQFLKSFPLKDII